MPDSGEDNHDEGPPRKRARDEPTVGRRKVACQTCRLRKIKCSLERPICSLCKSSGSECVYLTDPPKQTLEKVAETLTGRLDDVSKQLEDLRSAVEANQGPRIEANHVARHYSDVALTGPAVISPGLTLATPPNSNKPIQEPSRDFSHIPPHRTSADTVLTWPIYDGKFHDNYLIQPLLYDKDVADPHLHPGANLERDTYSMLNLLPPLEEERIPSLVDNFLQNVHTKNPVLDVETLVFKSRDTATQGLGWDAWSCVILLACALGSIAKPFGGWEDRSEHEVWSKSPSTQKELQQGENCFILACRRLGLLKQTLLAAQCHFFAGVYLMYTVRPMLSWQHFHQASITYQMYLKTTGRLTENLCIIDSSVLHPGNDNARKLSRLEQRLYWSCFKSETEFRVELPLPQSEIAEYEFPKLFPSPPSPPSPSQPTLVEDAVHSNLQMMCSPTIASPESARGFTFHDPLSIKSHAKNLCREEESWYYYLTEVALRRIGNRIINTFFTSSHQVGWMNIEPYLDIAMEFEAQVSSWYANLPPAMQRYETNSAIRAPRREPINGLEADFVSQELSWATENRLSEMRSWL